MWRGVKTGRNGQPSTKCEYFNGKVRHMAVDDDHELYLYVDRFAVKGVRKVHPSCVECPTDDWVVADGGRCYRESEVRSNFVEACLLKPTSSWSSAAQQCFRAPRGRGPQIRAIDSTTNSSKSYDTPVAGSSDRVGLLLSTQRDLRYEPVSLSPSIHCLGPSTSSDLSVVCHVISPMDWLPCMLQCIRHRTSRTVRLPLHTH